MSLESAPILAFVATANAEAARAFYEGVLGLRFVAEEPGVALVFSVGDRDTLRVSVLPEHTPPPHSVLGWKVDDIEQALTALSARGVVFEFFEMLEQDDDGICTFPNGDRVAWFLDPAGNMLSITEAGPT
ncbi:MAG: VOC family protein [Acidimicrobiia bacterium]|nr:VOC family protein [Acidimicrobiia bacterium]